MQIKKCNLGKQNCYSINHNYLFYFSFLKKLFIYWLHWVFIVVRGLSLVAVSGGLHFVALRGLLIAVASHCGTQALGARASVVVARWLSSCGSQALERRLSSCGAWA